MAVAPIRPLAWELPYAVGVAIKKTKKKKIPDLPVSTPSHIRTPGTNWNAISLEAVGPQRKGRSLSSRLLALGSGVSWQSTVELPPTTQILLIIGR